MENQEITIITNIAQVQQTVEQSGIEPKKGKGILEVFTPYFSQLEQLDAEIKTLPSENPSKEEIKKAYDLRQMLKKNRTAAEKIKDDGKRNILIEGKLYDHLFGIVRDTSKPRESQLEAIEKWHEIQEAKRLDELESTRKQFISINFPDVNTLFTDFRKMDEAAYNDYVNQLNYAKQEKIRIENERIAAEKAAAEAEAERLRQEAIALAEAQEQARIEAEARAKAEEEKRQAEEAARAAEEATRAAEEAAKAAEEERLAAERAQAEAEAEKQAAILAQEKAERERIEAEKQKIEAEKQRIEAEKLREAAELAAQKSDAAAFAMQKQLEAQQKAAQEAARIEAERVAAEQRAKAEEIKRAALAPDKDKLAFLITQINGIQMPELQTPEAGKITANVKLLLGKVTNYIIQESDKL
jgi:hypothetical protein